MSLYYRRDGTPYPDGVEGMKEWGNDFCNSKIHRVAQDFLPNGVEVSTVWLGLDHRYDEGRPLIFETMLFVPSSKTFQFGDADFKTHREAIGDCWRYSTEEEAKRGHKMLVKKWSQFKTAEQILGTEKK